MSIALTEVSFCYSEQQPGPWLPPVLKERLKQETQQKDALLCWKLITCFLQASGARLLSEMIPGKAIYLTFFQLSLLILFCPYLKSILKVHHHPPRNDKKKILWGTDTVNSRQVVLSTDTCVSLESQWYRPCIPLILLRVCLWYQNRSTGGVIWASLSSTCGLLYIRGGLVTQKSLSFFSFRKAAVGKLVSIKLSHLDSLKIKSSRIGFSQ